MTASVLVASRDTVDNVEKCLSSLLSQGVEALELCWHDDGSTDGTATRVAERLGSTLLAGRFQRIRFTATRGRRGLAHAFNQAARNSTGDTLFLLDAADSFDPCRIRVALERKAGAQDFVGVSETSPGSGPPIGWQAARLGSVSQALLAGPPGGAGNLVVSRHLFERLGGLADLAPGEPRDHAVWRFLLMAAQRLEPVLMPEPSYRLAPNRAQAQATPHAIAAVQHDALAAAARRPPANTLFPCPQRNQAAFWAGAAEAGYADVADRVFFPYVTHSRLLQSLASPT